MTREEHLKASCTASPARDVAGVAGVQLPPAEIRLPPGVAVPAWITLALDSRGLAGPEVDIRCGAAEPDVDLWECGLLVPTRKQVELLARLTEYPLSFFFVPFIPGPVHGMTGMVICYRRKVNGTRCHHVVPDVIDERGVLHYEGKPRQPPKGWNGTLPLF